MAPITKTCRWPPKLVKLAVRSIYIMACQAAETESERFCRKKREAEGDSSNAGNFHAKLEQGALRARGPWSPYPLFPPG